MSQENVENFERGAAAWNRDDFDAMQLTVRFDDVRDLG